MSRAASTFCAEDRRVEQVLHPDAEPGDLVAVGGPDAAAGGADLGLAEVALGDLIDGNVVRHDQVRVMGDQQPAGVDPALVQPAQFGQQHTRIDDDPVADDVRDARREDPRRDQVQGELLPVRQHHGVPGVVAALIPDDALDPLAVEIGGLALALVAPLGPDQHHHRHGTLPIVASHLHQACQPWLAHPTAGRGGPDSRTRMCARGKGSR